MTNSEHLEELLHECYELNIIEEVREEAISIMENDRNISMYDAHETAFKKILEKKL